MFQLEVPKTVPAVLGFSLNSALQTAASTGSPQCLSGVRSLCSLLADNVTDLKVKVFTLTALSQRASGTPEGQYAKPPSLLCSPGVGCWNIWFVTMMCRGQED